MRCVHRVNITLEESKTRMPGNTLDILSITIKYGSFISLKYYNEKKIPLKFLYSLILTNLCYTIQAESSNLNGDRVRIERIDTERFQSDSDFIQRYEGIRKEETNAMLERSWGAIRNFALHRKYSRVYNIRIDNNDISTSLNQSNVNAIFEEQTSKFKIQSSIGFILSNNTTEQLRYWHASAGHDKLFDRPVLIENLIDYERFIQDLRSKSFVEKATQARPNTEWSLHLVTNITFYVYPIPDFPIGCPTRVKQQTKNNKAIVTADLDSNGLPYQNNLCFYRALAYMRNQDETIEASTKLYFNEYLRASDIEEENYKGIPLSELPKLERIFQVSINALTLEERQGETTARLLYRSTTNYPEKLNLHVEDRHFSWVKNMQLYSKCYKCTYCSKLLKSLWMLKRHASSCSSASKRSYPSGTYSPPPTIFERLRDVGIFVDSSRQHYPYFAVYDCESYADAGHLPNHTNTIEWNAQHKLASVSVCTNISGFTEPKTFLNDYNDEFEVVKQMMTYLEDLANTCQVRLRKRYHDIFQKLECAREDAMERENKNKESYIEEVDEAYDKLQLALEDYLRDLLCFGFNSKGFDIPLMKKHIVRYLEEAGGEIQCVIKKGNQYMMIQTDKLRFLDITNYLPAGFSLDAYLRAMEVETGKFFWIYDRFTSMEVLNRTDFPAHEEFYSVLKRKNISDEDYAQCKRVWDEREMKTLRDMLIYYNECDVKPLVTAIERQNEFFKSRNLDFKYAMSIPGMAIRYLFQLKDKEAPIFLFGERFKDIHELVRGNIRGGLSLVFSRLQCAGETRIKKEYFSDNAKLTRACEGWDCSAMYLHNLTLCDMPTGAFVRRRRENGFKLEKSYNNGEKATEWVLWMGKRLNVNFQHMFNSNEKLIGVRKIPVDGYGITETGEEIILNYSGCFFHGHRCSMAPIGKGGELTKDLELQLSTYEILNYFETLGYTVYHTWECQFDKIKQEHADITDFCNALDFIVDSRYKLSETRILNEVKQGKLFGMIEVDIHTPERYKEIFSEFQPITKHVQLSREDIGEHMRAFAEEHDLLKKPTKTLLNSYYAKKTLLATPLLRWYLNHGLECTKVYQVIQYKPKKCFERFGLEVMNARREADIDPSKKIISDNMKYIGNSAYGKTLVNPEKHRDVSFHSVNDDTISTVINNKRFQGLDEVSDQLVEIESSKSCIRHNTPIQLGFFVLEYAKLLLLRFYYDFLLKYLSFDSFSLIQCDTDSLYLSFSEETFFLTIRNDMHSAFILDHDKWMTRDYCDFHKKDFFRSVFSGRTWQQDDCCKKASKYYLRQAGLFHLENVSKGVVALCSKSYYCYGDHPKYTSKGLSKRHNDLTENDYRKVLDDQEFKTGKNVGMRIKDGNMLTYTQTKRGLTYMYGKRRVCSDHVTTLPTLL